MIIVNMDAAREYTNRRCREADYRVRELQPLRVSGAGGREEMEVLRLELPREYGLLENTHDDSW